MYRSELQDYLQGNEKDGLLYEEENPFYVPARPQPVTNDAFVALGLSYITVSEFESVPKYVLVNIDGIEFKLNTFISLFIY